jgi:hypothetical protein
MTAEQGRLEEARLQNIPGRSGGRISRSGSGGPCEQPQGRDNLEVPHVGWRTGSHFRRNGRTFRLYVEARWVWWLSAGQRPLLINRLLS